MGVDVLLDEVVEVTVFPATGAYSDPFYEAFEVREKEYAQEYHSKYNHNQKHIEYEEE